MSNDNDDLALRECLEMSWFRVEARSWAVFDEWGDASDDSYSELVYRRIPVVKHTPKGAWLRTGSRDKRLVLREYQHRARAFAAPTLEQAKEDFRLRKQYHIACLKGRIARAEADLKLLDGKIREF